MFPSLRESMLQNKLISALEYFLSWSSSIKLRCFHLIDILEKTEMLDCKCKPIDTLMNPNNMLMPNQRKSFQTQVDAEDWLESWTTLLWDRHSPRGSSPPYLFILYANDLSTCIRQMRGAFRVWKSAKILQLLLVYYLEMVVLCFSRTSTKRLGLWRISNLCMRQLLTQALNLQKSFFLA